MVIPSITAGRMSSVRRPGIMLWIPGHMEGTGNFNAEQLYVSRDGLWQDIDTSAWKSDMARRWQHGLYAAEGHISGLSHK